MRTLHRLAPVVALLVMLSTSSAWAQDGGHDAMSVWGVFHVGISLAGTVFLLWLLKRGVEKL